MQHPEPGSRLAHVVNPVRVPETSDLHRAQPITFETMRQARARAAPGVRVGLYTAQFLEDRPAVPDGFVPLPDLRRSFVDVAPGAGERKLPLLADILDRLHDAADADHLIYTNVDIGLQPHFYRAVNDIIDAGHDAFSITRRTIGAHFRSVDEIPEMCRTGGQRHPGLDCFVFHRSLYPRLVLGDACIGLPPVGKVLWANLLSCARRPRVFRDLQLTFHIGDDGAWKEGRDAARRASFANALRVVSAIQRDTRDDGRRRRLQPFLDRIVEVHDRLAGKPAFEHERHGRAAVAVTGETR